MPRASALCWLLLPRERLTSLLLHKDRPSPSLSFSFIHHPLTHHSLLASTRYTTAVTLALTYAYYCSLQQQHT